MNTSPEATSIPPHTRVFVAGHNGLVGRALVRALHKNPAPLTIITRTSTELDLRNGEAVRGFFHEQALDVVLMAAGRVGGIEANRRSPVEFLYDNLLMGAHVIQAAAETNVAKLVYLGSSCIYPKHTSQPIHEASLLTGPLEPTNEGYAIAKIANLKLCEFHNRQYGRRFVSMMPTNLYGPHDRFDPVNAHVVPALLQRFHHAAQVRAPKATIWGSGTPRREFMHVDDLALAILKVVEAYDAPETINAGSGEEVSILELARMVATTVGFDGELVLDSKQPDGTPRKALDSSKLRALGWRPRISLAEGLKQTHTWALAQNAYEK